MIVWLWLVTVSCNYKQCVTVMCDITLTPNPKSKIENKIKNKIKIRKKIKIK